MRKLLTVVFLFSLGIAVSLNASEIKCYIDNNLEWVRVISSPVTPSPTPPLPTPIPIPQPQPVPIPTPLPGPIQGVLLQMEPGLFTMLNFGAGEEKVFIVRITQPVKGFQVQFVPMTAFTVYCDFYMPLKPDGTRYNTSTGRTEVVGLYAGYDGRIMLNVFNREMDPRPFVLDPYIYPGDFVIKFRADRAGSGRFITGLYR